MFGTDLTADYAAAMGPRRIPASASAGVRGALCDDATREWLAQTGAGFDWSSVAARRPAVTRMAGLTADSSRDWRGSDRSDGAFLAQRRWRGVTVLEDHPGLGELAVSDVGV